MTMRDSLGFTPNILSDVQVNLNSQRPRPSQGRAEPGPEPEDLELGGWELEVGVE
jgi:hypothetical protein